MKILIHSFLFAPSIGGIESASQNLAYGLAGAGHTVTVITQTACEIEREAPYAVMRDPNDADAAQAIKTHDLILSMGSAAKYFVAAKRLAKPFIWNHGTYRLQCIDGAGWFDGQATPLAPLPSCFYYLRHYGLKPTLTGAAKLYALRTIANMVAANVAVSNYQARRQPLPRQQVIYNPINISRFAISNFDQAQANYKQKRSTFFFLGRLISEKGVACLIKALAILLTLPRLQVTSLSIDLRIAGDGPEKAKLENLARRLGVADRIVWLGKLSEEALASEVRHAGICIVPSAWQEPMGIVVVELMAAGKPIIVSEIGGLSECAADAAKTFVNDDAQDLATVMQALLLDQALQQDLMQKALLRVKQFDPKYAISAYEDLMTGALNKQNGW